MLSFQATLTLRTKKLPPHVHLKMSLHLPVKIIRWIAHQMVLCQNLQIQPKTHSEQPAEKKNWCYYKTIHKDANSQSSIEILPSPHIVGHLFYFGMSTNIVHFKVSINTISITYHTLCFICNVNVPFSFLLFELKFRVILETCILCLKNNLLNDFSLISLIF